MNFALLITLALLLLILILGKILKSKKKELKSYALLSMLTPLIFVIIYFSTANKKFNLKKSVESMVFKNSNEDFLVLKRVNFSDSSNIKWQAYQLKNSFNLRNIDISLVKLNENIFENFSVKGSHKNVTINKKIYELKFIKFSYKGFKNYLKWEVYDNSF